MGDLAANLEYWMTNLPTALRATPIIYLTIPGSHDSGTFNISPASSLAPDAEPIIKAISFLGCILKEFLTLWSVTQYYTIRQQLYNGIRYLDLRIATKKNRDLFYFVHSMYSEEVQIELAEIKDFVDTHPSEIVILDCQHFYGFQDYDHKRFRNLLLSTFGSKLLPYTTGMKNITLQSMTETNRYQVIVIYREGPLDIGPQFWPTTSFPNPWANVVVPKDLITYLNDTLKYRDYSFGYVSQCILTPNASFILTNLCSTLYIRCFLPLEDLKYDWLSKQTPGPGGINIVISDFVDYEGDEFARTVIRLNQKLLDANQNIVSIDIEK